jgi:hypothetical protein
MKPGLNFLIIGGALLAVGLAVAAVSTFSVTKQVLEGSTVIHEPSLEPNLSFASQLVNLPRGQQLFLTVSGSPPDVPLQAKITGSDGSVLAFYNITKTPFTSTTTTEVSGNHTLEIKNVGTRSVAISGALLNSPIAQQGGGISMQDDPSIRKLVTFALGLLVGIVIIVAGMVLLIIGAIKYARGRTNKPQAPGAL